MALFLSITIRLPNNKDEKTEEGGIDSKLEPALTVHPVKGFVNDTATVIAKRVNPWFYGKYF